MPISLSTCESFAAARVFQCDTLSHCGSGSYVRCRFSCTYHHSLCSSQLDRKLEARRQDAIARQEKLKWRLAKYQQELNLNARMHGDLTDEDERRLIEEAKSLAQQVEQLGDRKNQAQIEADAAESEFHALRVAAGVQAEPAQQHPGGAYPLPDPEPIIARFVALEDDVGRIDEQLADATGRLSMLQARQAAIRVLAQPKAVDAADEEDTNRDEIEQLLAKGEATRRAVESMQREQEIARATKLRVEQAILVLSECVLNNLPAILCAPCPSAVHVRESINSSLPTTRPFLFARMSAVQPPKCCGDSGIREQPPRGCAGSSRCSRSDEFAAEGCNRAPLALDEDHAWAAGSCC